MDINNIEKIDLDSLSESEKKTLIIQLAKGIREGTIDMPETKQGVTFGYSKRL